MSACWRGSERSRPESQARQKICAGPMIWLKNSVERHRQQFTARDQRRAPAFDALGEARIFGALRAPSPLRSIRLREISNRKRASRRLFTTQSRWARTSCAMPFCAPQAWIDRRQHGGVVALQDFQEQRARQFLLRAEEMEKAAVGGPRPGADRRNSRALEAVAVEHRKTRGQQILSRASWPSKSSGYGLDLSL